MELSRKVLSIEFSRKILNGILSSSKIKIRVLIKLIISRIEQFRNFLVCSSTLIAW